MDNWSKCEQLGLECAVLEQLIRQRKVDAIKALYADKSLSDLEAIYKDKDAICKAEVDKLHAEGNGIRGIVDSPVKQESTGIPTQPIDKLPGKRGRPVSKSITSPNAQK
jgi:hypothetical protein